MGTQFQAANDTWDAAVAALADRPMEPALQAEEDVARVAFANASDTAFRAKLLAKRDDRLAGARAARDALTARSPAQIALDAVAGLDSALTKLLTDYMAGVPDGA